MNRREHYLEAERMLQTVLEGSEAVVGQAVSHERARIIQSTFAAQIAIAQVHATLATVPARWIAGEDYEDQLAPSPELEPIEDPSPRSKDVMG